MRIVSLLPSATEIVCALGLADQLVGVTHECDYPPAVVGLPKVTRTLIPLDAPSSDIDQLVRNQLKTKAALYTLDMQTLEELKPDMLITQTLCDVCAVSETEVADAACRLPGSPQVLNLEPQSLRDVFETLLLVGDASNTSDTAARVVEELQLRVDRVSGITALIPNIWRPSVAFLEWIDPPFNGGHWNPSLIELAGGVDVLGNANMPSKRIEWEVVVDADPDVLFISCCGFTIERTQQDLPILESKPEWRSLRCVQNHRVYITDGNAYFSRPGPRLVDGLETMAHALHPDRHGDSGFRLLIPNQ